ncbi:MAG: transglutaminase-like domain-containing protein [Oscillospiraceae bacterium]|nr:transglutaminase-like domain-containing protein [Oscillospiraceae bacterium]
MLALVMALIVIRTRAWYLAAMVSVMLVLSPILNGTLPMWGAMLASFSAWGAMLLTAFFSRKDPGSLGRAQLLSLTGMWAMILLLVMTLPMEGYLRPQWATDARSSLIRGVTAQMERLMDMDVEELGSGIFADLGLDLSIPGEGGSVEVSGPAGAVPGIGTGPGGTGLRDREDLLAAGPRRYAGRTVMTVSSSQPGGGRIYLRGGSLGIYTGDAWERLEAETGAAPSLYPAQTAEEGQRAVLTIRDISFQGTYYYPYRLTDGWGTTDESGRLTMPGGEEGLFSSSERYEVGCIPGTPEDGFTPLTGYLAEEELGYRREVVPDYLIVPNSVRDVLSNCLTNENWQMVIGSLEAELETAGEEEREALEASLEQVLQAANASRTLEDFGGMVELMDGMSPLERFRAVMTAASRTAALLEALAVYDPATPAMEAGEDFVDHFLTEGRGYCVHFATAGTLLLRLQGIPARYVSGYAAQLDQRGRGDVQDSDAHAWVEVYIDGCGWYPVEMTPGYSGVGDGAILSEDPASPVPETPDEPEPEEETPDDPEPDLPEPLPGETPPEEEAPEGPAFVFPWRAVLWTLLSLGALAGGYALSFLPRRLARGDADTNRSTINAYRRCRRVVDLGGSEDELLEELGRKARFSQHTLTEEEREAAWARLEAAKDQLLARRGGWRKALVWLIRPLL